VARYEREAVLSLCALCMVGVSVTMPTRTSRPRVGSGGRWPGLEDRADLARGGGERQLCVPGCGRVARAGGRGRPGELSSGRRVVCVGRPVRLGRGFVCGADGGATSVSSVAADSGEAAQPGAGVSIIRCALVPSEDVCPALGHRWGSACRCRSPGDEPGETVVCAALGEGLRRRGQLGIVWHIAVCVGGRGCRARARESVAVDGDAGCRWRRGPDRVAVGRRVVANATLSVCESEQILAGWSLAGRRHEQGSGVHAVRSGRDGGQTYGPRGWCGV
jgi:hypothetical protein